MRVVLVNEDAQQWGILRQTVRGVGLECSGADCIDAGSIRSRLLRRPPPDLVLVVTDGDLDSTGRAIAEAAELAVAPVFAVGPDGEVGKRLRIRAIESGAEEYFHQAVLREELSRAVERLSMAGGMTGGFGRTIAVTSAVHGAGVTTVATGLAFALAEEHPGRVLLAEVGTGVPTLAMALDLQVTHPMTLLAEGWARADSSMVRQAAVQHPLGVNVIAYAEETLRSLPLEAEAMQHIVGLFRPAAEFAVLDLGATLNRATRAAMTMVDDVVVITRIDVPSLRLTNAYLRAIRDADVPMDRVRLVANRFGEGGQLSWREAEKRLRLSVTEWVPNDPNRVNKALNLGQPIRHLGRSPMTKSFAKIANELRVKG